MALMISTGKNEDYKKWKKTINEIYDILDIETGGYLELTKLFTITWTCYCIC